MKYDYEYREDTHRGKVRAENEDSHQSIQTSNGQVFILCDGMGGAVGGKVASQIAVKSISEYFKKADYPKKKDAIANAIDFANEQIYATALADPSLKGMGTTCCVLVIDGDKIYYGHVGDSRIYLVADNEIHFLTKDHSYVSELIKQKQITKEEARTHPQRSRITRALGTQAKVMPTIVENSPKLKKGDTLLLCSDGLNDMVDDYTIKTILTKEESTLDEKAKSLIEGALLNGGKDNITIQIIKINNSSFTKTTFFDPWKEEMNRAENIITPLAEKEKKGFFSNKILSIIGIVATVVLLGGSMLFWFLGDNDESTKKGHEGSTLDSKEAAITKADTISTLSKVEDTAEVDELPKGKKGLSKGKKVEIRERKESKPTVILEEKIKTQQKKYEPPVEEPKTQKKTIPEYHIVKKEETLYSISKKYGITKDDLKSFNNLESDEIKAGEKLYLVNKKPRKQIKKPLPTSIPDTVRTNTSIKQNKVKTKSSSTISSDTIPNKKVSVTETEKSKINPCEFTINEIKNEYPAEWQDYVKKANSSNKPKYTFEMKPSDKKFIKKYGKKKMNFCDCIPNCPCEK